MDILLRGEQDRCPWFPESYGNVLYQQICMRGTEGVRWKMPAFGSKDGGLVISYESVGWLHSIITAPEKYIS